MKKIKFSKVWTLFLVGCLTLTAIPLNVFADEESESNHLSSTYSDYSWENASENANRFYAEISAENGKWESTSCKYISMALSQLSTSGVYSKIGAWAGQKFLNLLLGSGENPDRTDEILDAINQLNTMDQTQLLKLDQLAKIVNKENQLAAINEYYNGNTSLYVLTKIHMASLQINGEDENGEEENRKQILTYDIPEIETGNVNALNYLSEYDKLVLELGEKICSDVFLLDGTCGVAALMNEYAIDCFKWEHQGYVMRENYWSSLFSLYVSASNIMSMSLRARIEAYEENPNNNGKKAVTLRTALDELAKLNQSVQEKGEANYVNRLPENVRYYQVPGHEVKLFAQTTKQILPYKNAGRREDFDCKTGKTNKHWLPFYTYTDSSGKLREGLGAKYYNYIYNDYNPKGSTTVTSLMDIFFSENEGNFFEPEGIDKSGIITFVSSDIKTEYRKSKNIFGAITDEHWDVDCKLFEGYGKISDKYFGVASYVDAYTQSWHYIKDEYLESFIMVIPAEVQNDASEEVDGQIEYEEIVDSNDVLMMTNGMDDIATNEANELDSPETGDSINMIVCIVMFCVSGMLMLGMMIYSKKDKI